MSTLIKPSSLVWPLARFSFNSLMSLIILPNDVCFNVVMPDLHPRIASKAVAVHPGAIEEKQILRKNRHARARLQLLLRLEPELFKLGVFEHLQPEEGKAHP